MGNLGNFKENLFELSNYTRILETYRTSYPNESIFVVNGDELVEHPATEIKKVEKFLGLKEFFDNGQFFFNEVGKFPCFKIPKLRCMEKDKGLDHPRLRKETIDYLVQYFHPMIETLRKQTGVELSL